MIIALLTDFGLSDPYVGIMKGVILNINPDVQLVDISHLIVPQNINEAAFMLGRSYSYFPKGTIFVVVVDPGVGSQRSILMVEVNGYIFLAPDNGVLKYIFNKHPGAHIFQVTNQKYFLSQVSQTFHGRDIFAPVAAHLSKDIRPKQLGSRISEFIRGEISVPVKGQDRIVGEVIYFDRFGNGITNIEQNMIINLASAKIQIKNYTISKLSLSYHDVEMGTPLALIGSGGTVEISINQGNAKNSLPLQIGDSVTVINS